MARALVGLRGLSADASAWGNPYVVGVVGRGLEQDGLPDCLEGVQVPPASNTPTDIRCSFLSFRSFAPSTQSSYFLEFLNYLLNIHMGQTLESHFCPFSSGLSSLPSFPQRESFPP